MKFKNWFLYNELENPFTAEITDVHFDRYVNLYGEKGYKSDFASDDGMHRVTFLLKHIKNYPNYECYDINLTNPSGKYLLTGKSKNPNLVYSNLLKIILAFIKQFNPPLISFLASDPNMESIYKKFYDRFMKNMYIVVEFGLFMRKDLYESKYKSLIQSKSDVVMKNWQQVADESKETKRVIQKFIKSMPDINKNLIRKFVLFNPKKIAHTGMVDKDFGSKSLTILPTKITLEDEFVVLRFYYLNKKKKLEFAKVFLILQDFASAFKNASEKNKNPFVKLSVDDINRMGDPKNYGLANVDLIQEVLS